MTILTRSLVLGCSVLALAACGPDDIASPGGSGDIIINNPAPTPAPTPTPGGPGGVTPAAGCPTIAGSQTLANAGTITGPTGEWRVCTLPRVIEASITLPRIDGVLYQLNGRHDVGCDGGFNVPTAANPFTTSTVGCSATTLTEDTDVTLTIDPGVIVFAGSGQSWLNVNRGNKINAVGTRERPIIFTSRDNVLGLNTDNSQGQWGGVVLSGRAPITDCHVGTLATACERRTEGATEPALYGGNNPDDDSGQMSFVQIRYSGFVLSEANELQALTTGGTGSGTVLNNIQAHNSSDDGMEFFGGVVNFKYYIATGADDDSLDVDTGAQADFQHVLLLPRGGRGDALMEIDSNGRETDTPRTKLQVANFTAVQSRTSTDNEANAGAANLFRGNADVTLINGLIVTPENECIRLHGTGSDATRVTLTARSVALQCDSTKFIGSGSGAAAYDASQVAAIFGSNNNTDSHISTLTNLFINGSNESGLIATDPATFSSFFDTTTWVGAVRDADDRWFAGWTCNSDVGNFGDDNTGACTSLPVYSDD